MEKVVKVKNQVGGIGTLNKKAAINLKKLQIYLSKQL
jgi:hypothetical protein